ncbi:MAG: sulfite exporter TauE/SafE family protein [Rhodobiaceae bacterium]|nr:sulfite exporter TauE/SafE family protein [Rhodobiaceae bacterium]MCC0019357.1 sulfite exporter TauE/SafE family protein [Rhodobiaceae bacterium]MCC0061960.1 sulfite exporter TauE/SafE family protein [Rhodobiaceae bacterium]
MEVYLPIAEITVNALAIFGMGAAVGILAGMFGIGGGFLITPLLIFSGISPAVAVATGANQVIASSVSGMLAHWRRNAVDRDLGLVLLAGGIIGAAIGVYAFRILRQLGYLDTVIALFYVAFLGVIGSLMMFESVRAIIKRRHGRPLSLRRPGAHSWAERLPVKMRFKRSKLYISIFPVMGLGGAVGLLSAIMGVGGGFIMVPAMIYLLRVPTNVVIGTSLFQIVFVAAFTTMMQAIMNGTVDVVLAALLMIASVLGAQIGVQAAQKLKADELRALLALLVLAVCARLIMRLVTTPDEAFSITALAGKMIA